MDLKYTPPKRYPNAYSIRDAVATARRESEFFALLRSLSLRVIRDAIEMQLRQKR